MANVTDSLFPQFAGMLLGSPGQSQAQSIRDAYKPYDAPGSLFQGAIRGAGAELQAGVGRAFGQEPVEDVQKRKLQAIVQAAQQEADLGTPEGLSKLAEKMNQFPEFSGIALSLRQQAAQQAQQGQLKQSEMYKNIAQGAKATREGRTPLADRLVALQTKLNEGGELTVSEAAELKALEKVVKIQAPKGTDLSGFAEVMNKEAAKTQGKELGKQLATITGKEQAVDSLTEASKILDSGIYTGSYAEFQSSLAKKTLGVIGDKKRVENTEVFINEVNSNVIPLLQEFGGNDSNEELKFLKALVGGDITLEENSIRRILNSAIKKIKRGIKRLEAEKAGMSGNKPTETVQGKQRTTKGGITYTVEGE